MTLATIREDLRDIKYYYMRKDDFEKTFSKTDGHDITEKLQRYNEVMKHSSLKLYDLYTSLYVECHTQESLSNKLGFTPEYIQMLNKQLLKFLLNSLKEQKEQNL